MSEELFTDITFARSEAIKRNTAVTITPRDTATDKDWAKGWDVTITVPSAATLKSQDIKSGGVVGPGVDAFAFGSAGRPTATTAIAIAVKHSELSANAWRCITVDFSGRPTSKVGSCS